MAFSARPESEMEEIEEDFVIIEERAQTVARAMREPNGAALVFTGAGISTSAGISDFRGPDGVWTRKAKGLAPAKGKCITAAEPTFTHLAIVALHARGLVRCVVSQNVDGLHWRSGLPASALYELHGNIYAMRCQRCRRIVMGLARVVRVSGVHNTGLVCTREACGGEMWDSIIHFGENLEPSVLEGAFAQVASARTCLVLGSSLTVTPAANIPRDVADAGGLLAICNRQRTPLDDLARVRVRGGCDAFMQALTAALTPPLPPVAEWAGWCSDVLLSLDALPGGALRLAAVEGSGLAADAAPTGADACDAIATVTCGSSPPVAARGGGAWAVNLPATALTAAGGPGGEVEVAFKGVTPLPHARVRIPEAGVGVVTYLLRLSRPPARSEAAGVAAPTWTVTERPPLVPQGALPVPAAEAREARREAGKGKAAAAVKVK